MISKRPSFIKIENKQTSNVTNEICACQNCVTNKKPVSLTYGEHLKKNYYITSPMRNIKTMPFIQ